MKNSNTLVDKKVLKNPSEVIFLLLFSGLIAFLSVVIVKMGVSYFATNLTLFFCLWLIQFVLMFSQHIYIKQYRLNRGVIRKSFFLILYLTYLMTIVFSFIVIATLSFFAIPIALTSVLISVLLGRREAIVATISVGLSIVASCAALLHDIAVVQSIIAFLLAIFCGCFMVGIIKKTCTRFKLIAGCSLCAAVTFPLGMLASFIFGATWAEASLNGMWVAVGSLAGLVLASALLPIFESIFKVWTDFRIAEQCSFDKPLMRRLAETAPGTFYHSLVVGNLAEMCAMAIGENPYVAKISAYYHDIGKTENPDYFVENQKGYNPHDDLIPENSVKMITGHTYNGYEILKKNRIPDEIARITIEHHGTTPVMFFYNKAQGMTEGKLSRKEFCYENPKPTTKIAAIIMIADVIEAISRSLDNMTFDDLKKFVENIIKDKVVEGQFDDCPITMNDLTIVKEKILTLLPVINHKRIKYDTQKH